MFGKGLLGFTHLMDTKAPSPQGKKPQAINGQHIKTSTRPRKGWFAGPITEKQVGVPTEAPFKTPGASALVSQSLFKLAHVKEAKDNCGLERVCIPPELINQPSFENLKKELLAKKDSAPRKNEDVSIRLTKEICSKLTGDQIHALILDPKCLSGPQKAYLRDNLSDAQREDYKKSLISWLYIVERDNPTYYKYLLGEAQKHKVEKTAQLKPADKMGAFSKLPLEAQLEARFKQVEQYLDQKPEAPRSSYEVPSCYAELCQNYRQTKEVMDAALKDRDMARKAALQQTPVSSSKYVRQFSDNSCEAACDNFVKAHAALLTKQNDLLDATIGVELDELTGGFRVLEKAVEASAGKIKALGDRKAELLKKSDLTTTQQQELESIEAEIVKLTQTQQHSEALMQKLMRRTVFLSLKTLFGNAITEDSPIVNKLLEWRKAKVSYLDDEGKLVTQAFPLKIFLLTICSRFPDLLNWAIQDPQVQEVGADGQIKVISVSEAERVKWGSAVDRACAKILSLKDKTSGSAEKNFSLRVREELELKCAFMQSISSKPGDEISKGKLFSELSYEEIGEVFKEAVEGKPLEAEFKKFKKFAEARININRTLEAFAGTFETADAPYDRSVGLSGNLGYAEGTDHALDNWILAKKQAAVCKEEALVDFVAEPIVEDQLAGFADINKFEENFENVKKFMVAHIFKFNVIPLQGGDKGDISSVDSSQVPLGGDSGGGAETEEQAAVKRKEALEKQWEDRETALLAALEKMSANGDYEEVQKIFLAGLKEDPALKKAFGRALVLDNRGGSEAIANLADQYFESSAYTETTPSLIEDKRGFMRQKKGDFKQIGGTNSTEKLLTDDAFNQLSDKEVEARFAAGMGAKGKVALKGEFLKFRAQQRALATYLLEIHKHRLMVLANQGTKAVDRTLSGVSVYGLLALNNVPLDSGPLRDKNSTPFIDYAKETTVAPLSRFDKLKKSVFKQKEPRFLLGGENVNLIRAYVLWLDEKSRGKLTQPTLKDFGFYKLEDAQVAIGSALREVGINQDSPLTHEEVIIFLKRLNFFGFKTISEGVRALHDAGISNPECMSEREFMTLLNYARRGVANLAYFKTYRESMKTFKEGIEKKRVKEAEDRAFEYYFSYGLGREILQHYYTEAAVAGKAGAEARKDEAVGAAQKAVKDLRIKKKAAEDVVREDAAKEKGKQKGWTPTQIEEEVQKVQKEVVGSLAPPIPKDEHGYGYWTKEVPVVEEGFKLKVAALRVAWDKAVATEKGTKIKEALEANKHEMMGVLAEIDAYQKGEYTSDRVKAEKELKILGERYKHLKDERVELMEEMMGESALKEMEGIFNAAMLSQWLFKTTRFGNTTKDLKLEVGFDPATKEKEIKGVIKKWGIDDKDPLMAFFAPEFKELLLRSPEDYVHILREELKITDKQAHEALKVNLTESITRHMRDIQMGDIREVSTVKSVNISLGINEKLGETLVGASLVLNVGKTTASKHNTNGSIHGVNVYAMREVIKTVGGSLGINLPLVPGAVSVKFIDFSFSRSKGSAKGVQVDYGSLEADPAKGVISDADKAQLFQKYVLENEFDPTNALALEYAPSDLGDHVEQVTRYDVNGSLGATLKAGGPLTGATVVGSAGASGKASFSRLRRDIGVNSAQKMQIRRITTKEASGILEGIFGMSALWKKLARGEGRGQGSSTTVNKLSEFFATGKDRKEGESGEALPGKVRWIEETYTGSNIKWFRRFMSKQFKTQMKQNPKLASFFEQMAKEADVENLFMSMLSGFTFSLRARYNHLVEQEDMAHQRGQTDLAEAYERKIRDFRENPAEHMEAFILMISHQGSIGTSAEGPSLNLESKNVVQSQLEEGVAVKAAISTAPSWAETLGSLLPFASSSNTEEPRIAVRKQLIRAPMGRAYDEAWQAENARRDLEVEGDYEIIAGVYVRKKGPLPPAQVQNVQPPPSSSPRPRAVSRARVRASALGIGAAGRAAGA